MPDIEQRTYVMNPLKHKRRPVRNRGLTLVNAIHTAASAFVHDDESGLHADYEEWLEGLAPDEHISQYQHNSAVRTMQSRT